MHKNEKDKLRHEREKLEKDHVLDRHSSTGQRGLSKKSGFSGKGGWGKAEWQEGDEELDKNDPNYDSGDEEINEAEAKIPTVDGVIKEFFAFEDLEELSRNLIKLPTLEYPRFVKKIIFQAMEKQAYEKELVSKMLSSLYSTVLSSKNVQEGFQLALNSLEDLSLDIPQAVPNLAKFMARALSDEAIPPIFFKEAHLTSEKAQEAIKLAQGISSENHSGVRLQHIWGPGDLRSVKRMKSEIKESLQEYLLHHDKLEVEKSVRQLNCPSFHFQIVKIAIRLMIIDRKDKNILEAHPREGDQHPEDYLYYDHVVRLLSDILSHFSKESLITSDQFVHGVNCCFENLDDLRLDYPHVESLLLTLIQVGKRDHWLPQNYTVPVVNKK